MGIAFLWQLPSPFYVQHALNTQFIHGLFVFKGVHECFAFDPAPAALHLLKIMDFRKFALVAELRLASHCVSFRKKPPHGQAHLVFADTKANDEKPKELFFANAD